MGITVFLGTSMFIPILTGIIFAVVNFENLNSFNLLQISLTTFVSSFVPYTLTVLYSDQLLAFVSDETVNNGYSSFIQNYTSDITNFLIVWLFVFLFSLICGMLKIAFRDR